MELLEVLPDCVILAFVVLPNSESARGSSVAILDLIVGVSLLLT